MSGLTVDSRFNAPDPIPILPDADANRIILADEDWPTRHALSVVTEDFSRAANYRFQNHDWRWNNAEELYLGWVAQKYWEGTKIPRANISVMTVYEQVEAMIPRLMQAIFGDDPWFEATAVGSTSADDARLARDIVMAQLWKCKIRKTLKLSIKSALMYGNGILESSWHYSVSKRKKFKVQFVPRKDMIIDPFSGREIPVPTGKYDRKVVEMIEEVIDNRPILSVIPIKQYYIDPNCPDTDPNNARYTVRRSLSAVDFLAELRDTPGFDIPSDDATLIHWADEKPSNQADFTQSYEESVRLGSWAPQVDQSLDPASKRVELLRYKTRNREVWVVNQKYVIYNRTNQFGRIMQYSPFYTELVDRFYGMSIADVIEGEQRLEEGLINGRLDEVALNLHPSTKVKKGNTTPTYQLRVRPGGIAYSDSPKDDMIREYTSNVTAQAFAEVNAAEMRVQKRTGMTDLAIFGVSSGANPGARSATGAGLQGQASFSRTQGQVENITDEVIEPMLSDFFELDKNFLDPDQKIESASGSMLDPEKIFAAEVRFSSRAAARMQSRIGLLQIMPLIMQNAMNPWLVEQLSRQGKTVDFSEIFQMLLDATGYRKKADWIRNLTKEELQAMQHQKPSPEMIKWQMQKERMGSLADMQMDQSEMDLVGEIIKLKGAQPHHGDD